MYSYYKWFTTKIKLGNYKPNPQDCNGYNVTKYIKVGNYRTAITIQPGRPYRVHTLFGMGILIAVPYRDVNGLYNVGFYINTPIVSVLISYKSKLITLIQDATDKEYKGI